MPDDKSRKSVTTSIDPDLWQRYRVACAMLGWPLNLTLEDQIRDWLAVHESEAWEKATKDKGR